MMVTVETLALTETEARRLVAPLFDALNRPSDKDVSAIVGAACHDDYRSYYTNSDYWSRDQFIDAIRDFGKRVPDLTWDVVDVGVFGNQIAVRGRVTGTPVAEFFGARPTGKSFDTMGIDLLAVRDGKFTHAFHTENWMAVAQQLSA
jgi:predicted ester cyclase